MTSQKMLLGGWRFRCSRSIPLSLNQPEEALKMADHPTNSKEAELEWIAIEKSFREDDAAAKLDRADRVKNKLASNPFVPLGLLATVTALGVGLRSMVKGQAKQSQMMMRTRVVAQGLTFAAILVGIVMGARSAQQKPQ
ncbi:uncharacterized protein LOC144156353 [Haemaphysalis longicornis]